MSWQPLGTKPNRNTASKSLSRDIIVGITRELNKESLLNCYPIYIIYTWSMLLLFSPFLISMSLP